MSNRQAILIIGVGRSGTSALTRVLSLSGCTLPERVLGAAEINPRGSWEPIDIWKLNHEFMSKHDSEYMDPTMRLQDLTDDHEKEQYINQVEEFLAESPSGQLLIKQPDITEVIELWLEGLRRADFTVKIVIPIRHPQEVFASIAAMMGRMPSIELVNAFWLKRNLLAEKHSRNFPRIFVEYANLLRDWRLEITRISKSLSINLRPDEAAVSEFLTTDLHRQKYSGPIAETFGYGWVTRVYAILSAAAQDAPVDLPAMDEIYNSYRANERSFRIAWDEFRNSLGHVDLEELREELARATVWRSGHDF